MAARLQLREAFPTCVQLRQAGLPTPSRSADPFCSLRSRSARCNAHGTGRLPGPRCAHRAAAAAQAPALQGGKQPVWHRHSTGTAPAPPPGAHWCITTQQDQRSCRLVWQLRTYIKDQVPSAGEGPEHRSPLSTQPPCWVMVP